MLLRGCLLRMEAPLFDFFFIFSFLGVKQKQSHFLFLVVSFATLAQKDGQKEGEKGRGLGGIKSPHHVTTIATANLPFPSCKRLLLSHYILPRRMRRAVLLSLLSLPNLSLHSSRRETRRANLCPFPRQKSRKGREGRKEEVQERKGGGEAGKEIRH